MCVFKTVFPVKTAHTFTKLVETLSCNYLRRHKVKNKMEKKKRLMIGCGNHIESPN